VDFYDQIADCVLGVKLGRKNRAKAKYHQS